MSLRASRPPGPRTIRVVERFDVLVAGAGPAGSSTAIHLARAGARVLLADKARFPRDKPCGGGLTGRALKQIPVDPSPVVERDVDRFELRLRYGPSFTRSHDEPLIRMTQRRRLDAFLAGEAAEAGAELREGIAVGELASDDRGVTAVVGGTRVHADVVVGADGANGVVARTVGVGDEIVRGVALEGNVPLETLAADLERTAVIELAVVPGGYGWVFPKGDHANLGVGGWGSEGPRLRDHLATLARAHGVDPGDGDRGARSSAPDAEARARRPAAGACSSSATRRGSSTRSRATGCTRPSSPRGSPRKRFSPVTSTTTPRRSRPRSTAMPQRRGPRSAPSTAIRERVFAAARAPGVFRVVAGLLCGEVAHPADARGVARGPLKLIARLAG